ncbi:unnamed protein product [Owenia fusiformis]|uniref:Uncharacterized protein n=1 Tax=Owenia fusiformis TaxID=6347 RepID=A0A8J1U4R2_OWEFU|nr:unnamed protein product [Owenia fusiformis]
MDSVSSYAIDSGVFGADPNQNMNGDVDPATQKRRMEIIKEILDNFDLEETKERYRSLNNSEYTMDVNNLSIDSSMEGLRTKERMQYLMGSDVIQVGDKVYNDRLRERLQEEYNAKMDQREQELSQQEKRRVRRLVLQGVLHSSDEDEGACLHDNRHNTTNHKHTNKKKKKSPRRSRSQGGHSQDTQSTSSSIEGTMDDNASLQSDTLSQYLDTEDSAMKTYLSMDQQHISKESSHTKKQSTMERTQDRCHPNTNIDHVASSNQRDQDTGREDGLTPRNQDHHDPIVRKLHTEETVQGLYRLANILVTPRSDKRS